MPAPNKFRSRFAGGPRHGPTAALWNELRARLAAWTHVVSARWSALSLAQQFAIAASFILTGGMLFMGTWVANKIDAEVVQSSGATAALYTDSLIEPRVQELKHSNMLSPENERALDELLSPRTVGKTIVVRQKQTDPTFGTLVGYAMILPMKELEEQTAAEFFKKPIGTGPYRALAADVQGTIRYEAMGAEFKTPRGVPKLKEIEIQVIPDATTRTAALKTGVIDLLSGAPLPSLKSLESEGFTIASSPASSTLSYLFETRSHRPGTPRSAPGGPVAAVSLFR